MPKILPVILAFILVQVIFSSCDRAPEEAPAPIEQLMPLQVGNAWEYQETEYDTDGKVISTRSFTRTVLRDTTIQNSTWYILSNGSIVQNSSEGYVYFNVPGKQPVKLYQASNYGGIGYMYKYPQYDVWVLTVRNAQMQSIAAVAGTFECYLFRIENQRKYSDNAGTTFIFKIEDYVAPGIGLVRSDRYYADSDKLMQRHELVRYSFR